MRTNKPQRDVQNRAQASFKNEKSITSSVTTQKIT